MTAPRVTRRERDLSIYATGTNTSFFTALVLPTTKGKRNKAQLVTSRRQLLRMFTPNDKVEVGMNSALFGALNVLQSTDKLVVVVPKTANCKYAGITFKKGSVPTGTSAIEDPEAFDLSDNSFLIAASSQGKWGNDLFVSVTFYKDSEEATTVATTDTNPTDLIITTKQDWGTGFPVQVYAQDNALTGISSLSTYFVIRKSATSIALARTLAEAEAGTAIKLANVTEQKVVLSPAIYYTKEKDTICIRVFKKDDLNNPVKTYVVSKSQSARNEDGSTLYMEDVITDEEYITIHDNPLVTDLSVGDVITPVRLSGGDDGAAVTSGNMIQALHYLTNTNEFKIKVIGDSGFTAPEYQLALTQFAEKRADCMAVLSSPLTKQVNADTSSQEVVNYSKFEANFNTSWAAMFAPHVKIYDEFNDRTVWISPDSAAMRAIVDTASNFEVWYPPAGNRRGVVAALDTKIHYVDADQDLLYDNNVNPIIFEEGKGIKIWGQKTLYKTPSMLDRINVRMLLITIGPVIQDLLYEFLFEFNDEATRASVRALINSYMNRVKAKRGVVDFRVVCDETNNTAQEIDEHKLVVDLLVCPNSSIEFIPFTIGITNNSISFDLAQTQL